MENERIVPEDARVIVGAAIALWGATIVGAEASGLFGKLAFEETAALVAFTTIFALATYFLDPSVRAFVEGRRHRLPIAIALDIGVALAWPYAAALAFVLPLAAVATAAAFGRREAARGSPTGWGDPKVTSTRAKSPGARPAAT